MFFASILGKDMRIVSDVVTAKDIVQAVREATGKDVVLKNVDRTEFEAARSYSEDLWSKLCPATTLSATITY